MTSHIAEDYRHTAKNAVAGSILAIGGSRLKWYEVAVATDGMPSNIRRLATDFLAASASSGDLRLEDELGFIMLHRCGREFYFLLVGTWRGSNELWQTVYAKENAEATDFSAFQIALGHHATWCVWELGVVHHEMTAWTRYLMSDRGDGAADLYLRDVLTGPV